MWGGAFIGSPRTRNDFWGLVKSGLGIMPEGLVKIEPALVQALPTLKPIEFPIWLTAHRELNTSRRIRMIFDLLATELA